MKAPDELDVGAHVVAGAAAVADERQCLGLAPVVEAGGRLLAWAQAASRRSGGIIETRVLGCAGRGGRETWAASTAACRGLMQVITSSRATRFHTGSVRPVVKVIRHS